MHVALPSKPNNISRKLNENAKSCKTQHTTGSCLIRDQFWNQENEQDAAIGAAIKPKQASLSRISESFEIAQDASLPTSLTNSNQSMRDPILIP